MLISYVVIAFFLLAANGKTFSQKAKQRHCGLPDYIDTLPDYAQVELRDLWSSYVEGTPCLKEIAIQQDVLNLVHMFSGDFLAKRTTTENNSGRRSAVPAATISTEDYDEEPAVPTHFPQLARTETTPRPKLPSEAVRFDEATVDDIATMRFNNVAKAPFLHSAKPEVRRRFEKVWSDDDIPSESLRALKIQTLAVSLLTAKQLEEYNRWATKRRYVLMARERELRGLSPDAKRVLRRISNQKRNEEKVPVSPSVKRELSNFIRAFNRRRSKLLH